MLPLPASPSFRYFVGCVWTGFDPTNELRIVLLIVLSQCVGYDDKPAKLGMANHPLEHPRPNGVVLRQRHVRLEYRRNASQYGKVTGMNHASIHEVRLNAVRKARRLPRIRERSSRNADPRKCTYLENPIRSIVLKDVRYIPTAFRMVRYHEAYVMPVATEGSAHLHGYVDAVGVP